MEPRWRLNGRTRHSRDSANLRTRRFVYISSAIARRKSGRYFKMTPKAKTDCNLSAGRSTRPRLGQKDAEAETIISSHIGSNPDEMVDTKFFFGAKGLVKNMALEQTKRKQRFAAENCEASSRDSLRARRVFWACLVVENYKDRDSGTDTASELQNNRADGNSAPASVCNTKSTHPQVRARAGERLIREERGRDSRDGDTLRPECGLERWRF